MELEFSHKALKFNIELFENVAKGEEKRSQDSALRHTRINRRELASR